MYIVGGRFSLSSWYYYCCVCSFGLFSTSFLYSSTSSLYLCVVYRGIPSSIASTITGFPFLSMFSVSSSIYGCGSTGVFTSSSSSSIFPSSVYVFFFELCNY